MPDKPDLSAELDAADAIVTGGATAETQWAVRFQISGLGHMDTWGSDEAGARRSAGGAYGGWHGTLVRRTVTYGPWCEVPDASA
jgi:hypothetical protein